MNKKPPLHQNQQVNFQLSGVEFLLALGTLFVAIEKITVFENQENKDILRTF